VKDLRHLYKQYTSTLRLREIDQKKVVLGGEGGAAHIHNFLCRARQVTDGDQTTTGKYTEW